MSTRTYSPGELLVRRQDGTQWEVTGIREDDRCSDGVAYYVAECQGKRRLRYAAADTVTTLFERPPARLETMDFGPHLDRLVQGLRSAALSLIFAGMYVDAENEAAWRSDCDRYVAAITALGGDGTAEFDDAVEAAHAHWAERG